MKSNVLKGVYGSLRMFFKLSFSLFICYNVSNLNRKLGHDIIEITGNCMKLSNIEYS